MASFRDYLKCENIETIKDINDQYSYEDNEDGGRMDNPLVSCGQQGSYNELEYIYKNKLKRYVKLEAFTEEEALKALCETCDELESPRSRKKFYELLTSKLGVVIE